MIKLEFKTRGKIITRYEVFSTIPYLPDSSISNSVVLSFAGISSQGIIISSPTNNPKMTYTPNLLRMAFRM